MSKINILLIEDEELVSKYIQKSLKKLGYNIIGAAATGEEAIVLALETKPDLVLMDIMLKGEITGIDAAEKIREKLFIPVIYLTAYSDESTLAKAMLTQPYSYIIKPFKEVDLHTSIEMALYKHSKEIEVIKEIKFLYSIVESQHADGLIFVKSNSRLIKVKTNTILFVEALQDYVVINVGDAKYTIHSTMKNIQKKLPAKEFQRIHRSYIVRLDKIVAIEQPNVVIDGGKKKLPIGDTYKKVLLSRLDRF
jgi:two-component system response regulator LytT